MILEFHPGFYNLYSLFQLKGTSHKMKNGHAAENLLLIARDGNYQQQYKDDIPSISNFVFYAIASMRYYRHRFY